MIISFIVTAREKWEEGGMTSSLHGLYELGYTRTTIVITKRYMIERFYKTLKITLIQIILCNWVYEAGIVSNRRSSCYGESFIQI